MTEQRETEMRSAMGVGLTRVEVTETGLRVRRLLPYAENLRHVGLPP